MKHFNLLHVLFGIMSFDTSLHCMREIAYEFQRRQNASHMRN